MLATVSLEDVPQQRLVVPDRAIVREDNKNYVFVQVTPNRYRLSEVTLGPDLENHSVIASGIRPGDRIVVDGAFHLNNERKRLLLTGTD
jgi:membrane fusion protein, heavy metal efflux system